MTDDTPILPAHIEQTVQAIAKLQADHHQESGALQRSVQRLTASIGQPRSIAFLTLLIGLWVILNLTARWLHMMPFDPPPFEWLQGLIAMLALYVTILILTTQRREDQLGAYREQLTLELAILNEQKTAKIIALLEEQRRDNSNLRNRVDNEAVALAVAAEPQAVLDAIKETEEAVAPVNLQEAVYDLDETDGRPGGA